MSEAAEAANTFSVGATARLTGLSAHVLRAWERRYGAVSPIRSAGGTRRYRESDIARLRLLRAATAMGHPIGEIAQLSDAELRALGGEAERGAPRLDLGPLLGAIERLDAEEADRLLGLQLAALGPGTFGESVALPLLSMVGERWAKGQLCVASEHLASSLVRTLLGTALRSRGGDPSRPHVVFTTLPGERHELGLLTCAVTASEAGARCTYLGPDLPIAEIMEAVERLEPAAVAVGLCRLPRAESERGLRELRDALPAPVELWVGGAASAEIALPPGAARLSLDELGAKIALLAERQPEA